MTKILYIQHSGALGGAPRSLSFLLRKIDPQRYDATLICVAEGSGTDLLRQSVTKVIVEERMYPFHGSTVVPKRSLYVFFVNVLLSPVTFFIARKRIKAIAPDIVHLNSSSLCFCALAAKSANPRIKVICHVREPLRKSFFGWLIKKICERKVDRFIAIDAFSASSMGKKNMSKTDIIYNSVDMDVYHPGHRSDVLRRELGLDASARIFLFLARVAPGNGALELVKMARQIRSTRRDMHFVVVGLPPGSQDEYARKVVDEARDEEGIHVLTFRSDIPDVIASSDVMVVPFTEPHFARSIVEASALGVPSVGANTGGVNELIKHGATGYLYNDREEFIRLCTILADNEETRAALGREAVAFARDNFDNDKNAAKVFRIYEQVQGGTLS